ncbi:MAG: hypothetical protein EBQ89_10125 [Alphaproteobacteria bacterium]|nr:hypothetical protein [Alphaproteobacteria bacterium]
MSMAGSRRRQQRSAPQEQQPLATNAIGVSVEGGGVTAQAPNTGVGAPVATSGAIGVPAQGVLGGVSAGIGVPMATSGALGVPMTAGVSGGAISAGSISGGAISGADMAGGGSPQEFSETIDDGDRLTHEQAGLLREVATPLLSAVLEASRLARQRAAVQNGNVMPPAADEDLLHHEAEQFFGLLDVVQGLSSHMPAGQSPMAASGGLQALAHMVAGHYRATGQALRAEELEPLMMAIAPLAEQYPDFVAPEFSNDAEEAAAQFRGKLVYALAPVAKAVAHYAFGRPEYVLIADTADRLLKVADQLTRALAPAGGDASAWYHLCWSVTQAAAEFYAECHYGEADRILYMDAAERDAYFAANGEQVPIDPVWVRFNHRMALLATVAAYIDPPSPHGASSGGA